MSDAFTDEQLEGQKILHDSLPLIKVEPRARKKLKLIVLVGPSGSGKTTLAMKWAIEKQRHIRVNRDAIRLMLHGREWYPKREADVTMIEGMIITNCLKQGYNVISDATNLHPTTLGRMTTVATECGAELVVHDMGVDLEECIRRVEIRRLCGQQTGINRAIVELQALKSGRIPWPKDRKVVIVDIDGTAADLTHRLKYLQKGPCGDCNGQGVFTYDQSAFPCPTCKGKKELKRDNVRFLKESINDVPVEFIVKWVRSLYEDYYVVFVSARSLGLCANETIDWLKFNEIPNHRLFMRDANDHRQDTEVKQHILEMMIRSGLPKEQIAFCIDDRLSVVDMWRRNGLRVIPVRCSDRDFE